ncbi:MAG: L,D-transpeptidase [Rhodothermales bacterium]|nr:L,D-transpeptidase [Rhodothermales bacterium]
MDPAMEVYYTVERSTTLYHAADSSRPYLNLRFREPVYVLENGGDWALVRTVDGANGMVRYGHLSNVWIRVSKSEQTLYVYRGPELLASYPTDLGYNFFSDKIKRGSLAEPDHWRTPTGRFYVASKNASSQFYKALVLNYPNREDAERGMRDGIITKDQYESIVRADESISMPPMDTGLGGWIEIHGDGTGARRNWTQGCIAITNAQMDQIWNWVDVGTPVLVEP